jgi:hypothetical protein
MVNEEIDSHFEYCLLIAHYIELKANGLKIKYLVSLFFQILEINHMRSLFRFRH